MTTNSEPPRKAPLDAALDGRELRIAVAAFLARWKRLSRTHADSNLRAFLNWCAERHPDPLAASRPQVELHVP
jgi:hypothetical protein